MRPLIALILALLCAPGAVTAQDCEPRGVQLQVLGSGGPELQARRASSSYLVRIDSRARVLVDIGGGAALRFSEAGALLADLDTILLSHLHVDHSADLPALLRSALAEERSRSLPIYGPGGSKLMPSTVTFARDLFDNTRGAYRYLGDLLNPLSKTGYRLEPHDVREPRQTKLPLGRPNSADPLITVFSNERLRLISTHVAHGETPALAWRIEAGGKSIVLAGDTGDAGGNLARLARGADLLVAHHAVPEEADAADRLQHLTPSAIGRIAHEAGVKQLVLSHRTPRTLGRETETADHIRRHYAGPLAFANDLDCFTP